MNCKWTSLFYSRMRGGVIGHRVVHFPVNEFTHRSEAATLLLLGRWWERKMGGSTVTRGSLGEWWRAGLRGKWRKDRGRKENLLPEKLSGCSGVYKGWIGGGRSEQECEFGWVW
ncbi:hypothetical protein Adt_08482 [Abeliophyllum distichum]|uniref:Uncharacterized protein n=1 Tax=Abeliophyllum distichum TaxID=126358 RepID=A0ABD1VD26_9LAMI